jgi:hypothetical protein
MKFWCIYRYYKCKVKIIDAGDNYFFVYHKIILLEILMCTKCDTFLNESSNFDSSYCRRLIYSARFNPIVIVNNPFMHKNIFLMYDNMENIIDFLLLYCCSTLSKFYSFVIDEYIFPLHFR